MLPELYWLNILFNQLLNLNFVKDLTKNSEGSSKIILNTWQNIVLKTSEHLQPGTFIRGVG